MSGKENAMKIDKEERIRLTPVGYKAICAMVDRRASRDGYPRCEWCGKSIGKMDHHHIRYRSEYGSDTLENLILLCRDCHDVYAHGKKKHLYQKDFIDCRMNAEPIKTWNIVHQNEAQAIYKRYAKRTRGCKRRVVAGE